MGVACKLQVSFGTCFKVIVLTRGVRLELSSWLSGGGEVNWRGAAACAAAGSPQHPTAVPVPKTGPVILFSPALLCDSSLLCFSNMVLLLYIKKSEATPQ